MTEPSMVDLARKLAIVAGELDRRGFAYAGVVRVAARVLATGRSPDDDSCPHCGGAVERNTAGRPRTYCKPACRKAAWRGRKRDVMRRSGV